MHSVLDLALNGGECSTLHLTTSLPGKDLHYRLNRGLGVLQKRSGCFVRVENFLPRTAQNSGIYNKPTRCNSGSIVFIRTTSMLYMFRTLFVSIIRSNMNCNSSHWCLSSVGMEKILYNHQGRCALYYSMAKMRLLHTDLDSYTGFITSQLMTDNSGCCYSLQCS